MRPVRERDAGPERLPVLDRVGHGVKAGLVQFGQQRLDLWRGLLDRRRGLHLLRDIAKVLRGARGRVSLPDARGQRLDGARDARVPTRARHVHRGTESSAAAADDERGLCAGRPLGHGLSPHLGIGQEIADRAEAHRAVLRGRGKPTARGLDKALEPFGRALGRYRLRDMTRGPEHDVARRGILEQVAHESARHRHELGDGHLTNGFQPARDHAIEQGCAMSRLRVQGTAIRVGQALVVEHSQRRLHLGIGDVEHRPCPDVCPELGSCNHSRRDRFRPRHR